MPFRPIQSFFGGGLRTPKPYLTFIVGTVDQCNQGRCQTSVLVLPCTAEKALMQMQQSD